MSSCDIINKALCSILIFVSCTFYKLIVVYHTNSLLVMFFYWTFEFCGPYIHMFTFQIDPSLLQQTLQQGNVLAQQLTGDPSLNPQNTSLQTADSSVPANVVIQPLSSLSLQPTVTSSANMSIGPMSEQESVLTTSTPGRYF